MFNFFDEIKKNLKGEKANGLNGFNIVNVSGKQLYVEGHKGLLALSKEMISFKVVGAIIFVDGQDMVLEELSENTIKIVGQISVVQQK